MNQASLAALVERLEALVTEDPEGVLAFDGDGTLWSGDVGEDLFHRAVELELLTEAAIEALAREAEAFALSTTGSANQIAHRLFAAYAEGRYPEREVCAMMSWCFAGWSASDLEAFSRETLEGARLRERLHTELEPVFAFARRADLTMLVVSASPQAVVEGAAAHWGIAPQNVVASRPAEEAGRILPRLAAPVPYAEAKPAALRTLVGERSLLASFGDNVFDLELLHASRLPVAVRPKASLKARLFELPGVAVLE